MAQLERAVEFVRQHGTAVEQARLEYLLTGQAATRETADALFVGQRPDGGWAPFWAPDYSSLDATCYQLAQADQLGLAEAPPARRALQFLTKRQRPDGSWEEDASVEASAPPWARPGDLAARLYLTANCGYWIAVLGDDSATVAGANRYPASYLQQDSSLPSFPHAHWLAAGLWYRVGDRAAFDAVTSYLATLVPNLASSNLGWLVVTLRSAGVPSNHPLLTAATSRLAQEQQAYGRWISEDGSDRDVHATLEAIRAIRT